MIMIQAVGTAGKQGSTGIDQKREGEIIAGVHQKFYDGQRGRLKAYFAEIELSGSQAPF